MTRPPASLLLAIAVLSVAACASSSSPAGATPQPSPDLSTTAPSPDPRVGLRAGWMNPGEAAWNLRVVSKTPPSEKLIELKFNELLLHIVNNPENTELIAYMHLVASHKTGTLEKVMEANYPYNLTLAEYATLCNRSLSSFKRDFEATYKTSPGRWLLNKRLEHAHRLLSNVDKTLFDVLLESGFENQAHFSSAFKARFGQSPLQYRKTLEATVS